MTPPLPNLPVAAPSANASKADSPKSSSGDEFDGMFREQMMPVSNDSDVKPSAEGNSGDTAVSKESVPRAPEEAVESSQAESVQEPLLVEHLVEPTEPSAGKPDAEPLIPGILGPPPVADAAVLGAAAPEPQAESELLEELVLRTPGDRPSVFAAEKPPRVPKPAAAQPGIESTLRPFVESQSVTRPVMPGPAEGLADQVDSPTATRAGSPAAVVQAVTTFATTMQSASSATPRVQILEPISVPVADPQWGAAVAARLTVSMAPGIHSASIALTPQDLGPLELTLRVSEDETSVTFVSNHPAVRDAVEASLPRLREMFAAEGISLGDVDVFSGGEEFAQRHEGVPDQNGTNDVDNDASTPGAMSQHVVAAPDSLVDTFV